MLAKQSEMLEKLENTQRMYIFAKTTYSESIENIIPGSAPKGNQFFYCPSLQKISQKFKENFWRYCVEG